MEPQGQLPDLGRMSSRELGSYGRSLHEHNQQSGVRHVLIARVLREARERGRHAEEGLGFGEWTRRYFGFGEEQAARRMRFCDHPIELLAGQAVSEHQLYATVGAEGPVLRALLGHIDGLSEGRIRQIKRAGRAWLQQGKGPDEVAALVAQAAQGALALGPRRRAARGRPGGRLGRGQVLRPFREALDAVAVLRERRLRGEALSGPFNSAAAEVKEAMRALLWQVPELYGQDPAAFAAELLAERRAAPREEAQGTESGNQETPAGSPVFPAGENHEKDRSNSELGWIEARTEAAAGAVTAGAAAGEIPVEAIAAPAAEMDEGPAIEEAMRHLPETQRAWLGERLFKLLSRDPGEDAAASLASLYEAGQLGDAGVSRAGFHRWLDRLCEQQDATGWDAAFELFERAELPGFRGQLYLLRTYPLGEAQRTRVLALCRAVALYPRYEPGEPPGPPAPGAAPAGPPAESPGGHLSPEHAELLRDAADLRRLQAELEATWSDEHPLRLDVQHQLFEAQMELEKAVLAIGSEKRQRDARLRW